MDNYPLISYLVASYNHQAYIEKTLESILLDGYPNREILIVDDGSSDGSVELLAAWIARNKDERVTFRSRPNAGVTTTLNELINLAQGEYVRPCSSDDILVPGSTMVMAEALSEDETLEAVFGDGYVIDDAGRRKNQSVLEYFGSSASEYSEDLTSAIIARWAVAGPVLVARRNYLCANPYPENLTVEDWYMYVRLAADEKIGFIPGKVIEYRLHSTNSSKVRITDQRIRNLTSQAEAASLNLPKLQGSLAMMLRSQRALLRAKIDYLRGHFVRGVMNMFAYMLMGQLAYVMRALRH